MRFVTCSPCTLLVTNSKAHLLVARAGRTSHDVIMRFVHDRQTGKAKRPPPHRFDRRGRHTKQSLAEGRRNMARNIDSALHPVRGCGCDRFNTPVDYSSAMAVCTGCGLVFEDIVLIPSNGVTARDDGNGRATPLYRRHPSSWLVSDCGTVSAPYKPENHLAELLKQATDTDPRIPKEDIVRIYKRWLETYAFDATSPYRDPLNLDPATTRSLILALKDKDGNPDTAKQKKYGERWLQIKRFICGPKEYDDEGPPLMSYCIAEHVHRRYQVFAAQFKRFKDSKHPLFVKRNNIPNLNTVVRHLLYQIGKVYHDKYGWYFTGLNTIESRIITEIRIALIIKALETTQNNRHHGGFYWKYTCLLPAEDRLLFKNDPAKFKRIQDRQIQLACRKQPRRQ